MNAIHQLVAGYANGDAISNEARALRAIFQNWGHPSAIYSEAKRILPELQHDALDLATHINDFAPDDIALLHLSIGSNINDLFARLPCKKVILYHNITPAEYFHAVHPHIARDLERGRAQALQLAHTADLNLAVSHFNAGELHAMGYADVQVLPLLIDFSHLRMPPEPDTLAKFQDGLTNILFVGRCVPNKRIEDVISAFYYFQRYHRPYSRLILIGSPAGMEKYRDLLKKYAHDLGVTDFEAIGAVTQPQLNAAYAASHAFLCMSDHEGFCIPLIEAMLHRLPVLAYAAGAVEETLDGAGILFREKRFDLIAETLARLTTDPALRSTVLAGQNQRLQRYETQDLTGRLRQLLAPLLHT